jgi:hypothetical protein
MMLCITGDIARGGKALSSFSASSQGRRSRQRVPSPRDPASEKVVCERDVQAHQARSSPGATQKAGFSRRRHRSLRKMADGTAGGVDAKLMHPSIQRICWLDGIGRCRAPHAAHVAYGSRPCENSKVRSATRMISLISISKLNALAMWAHETILNE